MQTETGSSTSDRRARAAAFDWYHTIDLGDGIVTDGQYDLAPYLPKYGLPDDLRGRSVLDVGPAHGYFAFEFERRGAIVTTAELPSWTEHDASPDTQAVAESAAEQGEAYHKGAFGFALEVRQSKVRRLFCNIYDLTPERVGTFDLVFCASVLLHLTDPLRALYGLRRVCTNEAIISTGIDNDPAVAGQSRATFVGTASGHAFWLPTQTCLERMALAAGFARVEPVSTFVLADRKGIFKTPHGTIRAFVR